MDPLFPDGTNPYADLVNAWAGRFPDGIQVPSRILVVAAQASPQTLGVLEDGNLVAEYTVSTARNGLGAPMDSDMTPPGWLTICGRIGNGYAPGTCFEKKAPTGAVWRPGGSTNPARMLTRLIVLQGLEDGVNLHGNVDTFARGIYIHGTNVPAELGNPASHGCVRMDYQEVVELFDRVQVGDGLLVAGDPSA